jgi:hypothetical protein
LETQRTYRSFIFDRTVQELKSHCYGIFYNDPPSVDDCQLELHLAEKLDLKERRKNMSPEDFNKEIIDELCGEQLLHFSKVTVAVKGVEKIRITLIEEILHHGLINELLRTTVTNKSDRDTILQRLAENDSRISDIIAVVKERLQ